MLDAQASQLAQVVRGGFVESVHTGHVAVVAQDGGVAFAAGDPDAEILPRSSIKPLQALASLTAGAPLAAETLALACGSHAGEPFHVAAVDQILAKAGLDRSALQNVAAWPQQEQARLELVRAGFEPEPAFMNCSGKHAAMLAACTANDWPTDSYLDPEHPLQRYVLDTVAGSTSEPIHSVVVDGCGAPCPGMTLASLARSVSRLVVAAEGSAERIVADAIRDYPAYVGGTRHANTRFMQLVPGSVVKGGAEGVLVAALDDGTAVAVKCADGGSRATTAVAVAALRMVGADLPAIPELELVPVLGGGQHVGRVVVTVGEPATDADLR